MALSSYKAEDVYRCLPLANNFPPQLAHKYSVCHLFSCDYNKKRCTCVVKRVVQTIDAL